MNHYEWKQEQRRQRLERAAERAASVGNAALNSARTMLDCIPFGQPILVGHHSEKRHRGLLRRHDGRMRAGFAKLKEAEDYARRAAGVGTAGISSDDPDAVPKLETKVEELERKRDHMKTVNALYRKKDRAGLAALGLDYDALKAKIDSIGYSWEKAPYAPYQLQNLGARIRDAKKRAERLDRFAATAKKETVELPGGATIDADPDDNRVTIRFNSRLSREAHKTIRRSGFVWSPTRAGYTRKLTGCPVEWAKRVAESVLVPAQETA